MTEAITVLEEAFESVTGRPLEDPNLDIFDLGLDSIDVLSLLSRLRDSGYRLTIDDLLSAERISEVAERMNAVRE